ncbi:hypothetical protein N665_0315s0001 [Sinapis alba]|nr:hypothetical protein N665_0315s0001 [Sinapis alba]
MTNVGVIAAILIAASLSASVTEQMAPSPFSEPSGAPDCMTNLLNMTDCLSYVQVGNGGGVANPDKACCPELAGLVDSSPQCLCYLLDGDMAAQYGIKIDKAKALKLPGVCGVVTPDPSLCSLFRISVGAPEAMGNEEASPAFAPASGAESPEGLGSGPSATRASDAPSTAPYSLILIVIIIPLAFAFHLYS